MRYTKYTKEMLEEAVKNSKSVFDVMRKLGFTRLSTGSHSHIKSRLKYFNIDTSHFTGQGWNKGGTALNKKAWKEYLVLRTDGKRQKANILRRSLLESGVKYKCNRCDNPGVWNNQELVLEVNHKNNNYCDDRPENLEFVCPNCHSQLPINYNKNMAA